MQVTKTVSYDCFGWQLNCCCCLQGYNVLRTKTVTDYITELFVVVGVVLLIRTTNNRYDSWFSHSNCSKVNGNYSKALATKVIFLLIQSIVVLATAMIKISRKLMQSLNQFRFFKQANFLFIFYSDGLCIPRIIFAYVFRTDYDLCYQESYLW